MADMFPFDVDIFVVSFFILQVIEVNNDHCLS